MGLDQDPVMKGIEAAKYLSAIPPISALGVAVYAFSTAAIIGYVIGTVLIVYSVLWLFANGSGFVLITVRNYNATRAELRNSATSATPAPNDDTPATGR